MLEKQRKETLILNIRHKYVKEYYQILVNYRRKIEKKDYLDQIFN